MSTDSSQIWFRRLVSRVAAGLTDMWYAQHRVYVLRTALDRYVPRPDEPPQTYSEFLTRTSGALLHEPPARQRVDGRRVG